MQKIPFEEIWNLIYRQWIWADQLRSYFELHLPEKELNLSENFTIEPYLKPFTLIFYNQS